ncbi:hypothetical protein [Oceanithermus sp.]
MKKTVKNYLMMVLALGVLGLGWALAAAPTLPEDVQAAIDSGAIVSLYDADGNLLWSSDSGTTYDPELLTLVAEIVVTDADGAVVADLEVVVGPNGNLVIQTDDGTIGLGKFLHDALGAQGTGVADGTGEQHQYRHMEQAQHQTQGACEDAGCQYQDAHANRHGPGQPSTDQ